MMLASSALTAPSQRWLKEKKLGDLKMMGSGQAFDLNNPAVTGLFEMTGISLENPSAIKLESVYQALVQTGSQFSNIQQFDITSGINKILKSSIKEDGLEHLNFLLASVKAIPLRLVANSEYLYGIDEKDKLKFSGKAYQCSNSIRVEDVDEQNIHFAFTHVDSRLSFVSSDLEACHRNMIVAANCSRLKYGVSKYGQPDYHILMHNLAIYSNDEKLISYDPEYSIELWLEDEVKAKDHNLRTSICTKNEEFLSMIKSGKCRFLNRLKGKILEQDLGM